MRWEGACVFKELRPVARAPRQEWGLHYEAGKIGRGQFIQSLVVRGKDFVILKE